MTVVGGGGGGLLCALDPLPFDLFLACSRGGLFNFHLLFAPANYLLIV